MHAPAQAGQHAHGWHPAVHMAGRMTVAAAVSPDEQLTLYFRFVIGRVHVPSESMFIRLAGNSVPSEEGLLTVWPICRASPVKCDFLILGCERLNCWEIGMGVYFKRVPCIPRL